MTFSVISNTLWKLWSEFKTYVEIMENVVKKAHADTLVYGLDFVVRNCCFQTKIELKYNYSKILHPTLHENTPVFENFFLEKLKTFKMSHYHNSYLPAISQP